MPLPLFLHQKDAWAAHGCSNPFCAHDHGTELFLTPLCHPGVGIRVEVMDALPGFPWDVVHLRCWTCQATVVQVALTTRLELTPACWHGSALDVMYSEGNLTVSCPAVMPCKGQAMLHRISLHEQQ